MAGSLKLFIPITSSRYKQEHYEEYYKKHAKLKNSINKLILLAI
ncbi:hypothetical protein yrohd0001_14630 [Yersinia rohdei ATCC 43380]|nr:hypothetical protein yrohd0001_14630 [Yersinia rohdei ATCC 43380]